MAAAGDVFAGRYRIEGPLGAGGMATVLLAHDTLLGRQVAVKLLASNVAANPALLERFGREARAMATITHPNLVAIYDVGWADADAGQAPFLVMELVSGGTLAERLATEGPLAPPAVIELVEGLASALETLHGAGIVHRDVKPQNVLLAPSGPKLADLGVIRVDDPTDPDAGALTASGAVPGTLRFLAPEVIFGQPAGPKADAYALAMVAYEALTGRSPRPAMTLGELVHGAWEPVTLVSAARPKLGTSFDAPFAAALDLDPNRRLGPLAFAAELWQAVTAWAAAPAVATDAARPAGTDDAPTVLDGVAAPDAADDSAPSAGTATEVSIPEAHTTAAAGAVETEGVADAVTAPAAPITEVAALSGIARPNPTAFLPGEDTTGVDRPADRRQRVLPESVRAEPVSQVLVALVIVAVVLGLVVVGLLVTQGGSTPAATAPGASGPDASGSGPASSAAATPSPTAPDPAAAARQALEDVKAAIEQARGGRDGLKGADANELADLADDIGRALEAGDYESAHSATEKLAERVDKVGDELDKASRDALVRAVDALLTAIPPA